VLCIWCVFSCVGAVVGCRSRPLLTGFSEVSYDACVAVVLSVEWGLWVGFCVVWVYAVCWVLRVSVIGVVRLTTVRSGKILLHLVLFLEFLALVTVRSSCLVLGCVGGVSDIVWSVVMCEAYWGVMRLSGGKQQVCGMLGNGGGDGVCSWCSGFGGCGGGVLW